MKSEVWLFLKIRRSGNPACLKSDGSCCLMEGQFVFILPPGPWDEHSLQDNQKAFGFILCESGVGSLLVDNQHRILVGPGTISSGKFSLACMACLGVPAAVVCSSLTETRSHHERPRVSHLYSHTAPLLFSGLKCPLEKEHYAWQDRSLRAEEPFLLL